ncbi:MAG: MGMT family protein [bacterium]|nr:MGMT family protein [bacterium]
MATTSFQKSVYAATRKIPRGKVSTYAAIARAIGKPKAVRAVGNALNKNLPRGSKHRYENLRGPNAPRVPCHRVVRSDGSIGGYAHGMQTKIALLRREGIFIRGKKVSTACILRVLNP